ncbi:MAG: hypothetical protein ACE5J7_02235 [Candidatus Aenigmatarchaeota archaeon]
MTLLGSRARTDYEDEDELEYREKTIKFSEALEFDMKRGRKVIDEGGCIYLTETGREFVKMADIEPLRRKDLRKHTHDLKKHLKDSAIKNVSTLMLSNSVNIMGDYLKKKRRKKARKREKIKNEDRKFANTLKYINFAQNKAKDYEGKMIKVVKKLAKKLHDEDIENDLNKLLDKEKYEKLYHEIENAIERAEICAEELEEKAGKNKKKAKKFREEAEWYVDDIKTLEKIKVVADTLNESKEITKDDYLTLKKYIMGKYSFRNSKKMNGVFNFYFKALDKINKDKEEEEEDKIDVAMVMIKGELRPLKYVAKGDPLREGPYSYEGIERSELHIIDEDGTAYIFDIPEEFNKTLFAYSFCYDINNKSFFSGERKGTTMYKNLNTGGAEFYDS